MSLSPSQQQVIDQALSILSNLYQREPLTATSPELVKQFCQLQAGHLEHEVFGVLFLDNRNQLIKSEQMFRGTIDGSSVHPRECVKTALLHNAAALIFYHNHPSSIVEPSAADKQITARLIDAMGLVDIRVLDHIIVSCNSSFSFAENGLL